MVLITRKSYYIQKKTIPNSSKDLNYLLMIFPTKDLCWILKKPFKIIYIANLFKNI